MSTWFLSLDSMSVTPSEWCKSNMDSASLFTRLLECLRLDGGHNLFSKSKEGEKVVDCHEVDFTHIWTSARKIAKFEIKDEAGAEVLNDDEISSYKPLVECLRNVALLNAVDVSSGQGPNRLLFDVFVYSLQQDVGIASKVLRRTFDEPREKFRLKGRTDVAVLIPESVCASLLTTFIAIQVK